MPARRQQKRRMTAREGALMLGISERQVRALVAQPRSDWLRDQKERREAIRAYHDDEHHTWPQTADHYRVSESTAKQLAYRARKERAREAEEAAKGPTLFDIDLDES